MWQYYRSGLHRLSACAAAGLLAGLLLLAQGCAAARALPGKPAPTGTRPGDGRPAVGQEITLAAAQGGATNTLAARVVKSEAGWPTVVTFADQTPARFDPTAPFGFWTAWSVEPLLRDSLVYTQPLYMSTEVATPEGTFSLRVKTVMLARTPGGEDALLAFVAFDPAQKAPGALPLTEEQEALLQAAQREGLLTDAQKRRVDELSRAYGERYAAFLRDRQAFAAGPQDAAARDRFLSSLWGLWGDLRELADTSTFYTEAQRVALRRLGHTIKGGAYAGERDGMREIHLRSYPLSDLAADWNGNPGFLSLPPARPRLSVTPDRQYDEVDLTVRVALADPPERQLQTVLEAIGAIDGIAVER